MVAETATNPQPAMVYASLESLETLENLEALEPLANLESLEPPENLEVPESQTATITQKPITTPKQHPVGKE